MIAARDAGGLDSLGLDELRARVRGRRVAGGAACWRQSSSDAGRSCSEAGERPQLSTPEAVGRYLLPLYGGHREERFGVVMLDAKNRLIRTEIAFGRHARRQPRASARDLSRGHGRVGVVDCRVSQPSVGRSATER